MFDRHQAEITVMQFRGHSLPVHQSMSVPWDFLPCPISLAKPAYAISSHNCHWNVSLPSGASPWHGKFGWVEDPIVRGTRVQSQVESYQRLDATLLSTQHYQVRIKSKVKQSREWSSTLPYTSV